VGSDRPGAAVLLRRLLRPGDSRRAGFLLPMLQAVRETVRNGQSADVRSRPPRGIDIGWRAERPRRPGRDEARGTLPVFPHVRGSGRSFTMHQETGV